MLLLEEIEIEEIAPKPRPFNRLNNLDRMLVLDSVRGFVTHAKAKREQTLKRKAKTVDSIVVSPTTEPTHAPVSSLTICKNADDSMIAWLATNGAATIYDMVAGLRVNRTTALKRVNRLVSEGRIRIAKREFIKNSGHATKYYEVAKR